MKCGNWPKEVNNFKYEIQEISKRQIPIRWARREMRIKEKNCTRYLNSGHKIIDNRRKFIKGL
jgi:hypothetical protein